MRGGDITLDGLGAERHAAIDPDRKFRGAPAPQIGAEIGRYLNGQRDLVGTQAPDQLRGIRHIRAAQEIA